MNNDIRRKPDIFLTINKFYHYWLASTGGRGAFGCLLSKCCLYVLGSGIWDWIETYIVTHRQIYVFRVQLLICWLSYAPLTGAKLMTEQVLLCSRLHTLQTVQVKTSAFCAAAFWSGPPWAFLSFSCFCAFFCWDWNFWWPRAIGNYSLRRIKKSRIIYINCKFMWH